MGKRNIYHVSQSGTIKSIKPTVPNNYMTKNGYEDGVTPRVCFTPSIDKCLMALSKKCTGMELYVYVPAKDYELYYPTAKQVPDVKITSEIWIKDTVQVKCIGKIRVIGDKGLKGHKYKYGNKTAELYDWDWEWTQHEEV